MTGIIVPATTAHARQMAPYMRDAEVQEVWAASGRTPEAALLFELQQSLIACAWLVDDQVACMFGIVKPDLFDDDAYPWLLTTPLVEQHPHSFARQCRQVVRHMLAAHSTLSGMVDARYHLSIRWLRWIGATLEAPQPWGAGHALFCRFEIKGCDGTDRARRAR